MGLTNWIHDTNILKKGLWIKSAIQIFTVRTRKSGFTSPPAWICEDSGFANLDFWRFNSVFSTKDLSGFFGFMKTGQIFWKSVYESNPRTKSFEKVKALRICIVKHKSNLFGVRICDRKMIRIHGFSKQILVFTNLLYDSRILKFWSNDYICEPKSDCIFQTDCFYAGLAFVKDHAIILAALAIGISATMVSRPEMIISGQKILLNIYKRGDITNNVT